MCLCVCMHKKTKNKKTKHDIHAWVCPQSTRRAFNRRGLPERARSIRPEQSINQPAETTGQLPPSSSLKWTRRYGGKRSPAQIKLCVLIVSAFCCPFFPKPLPHRQLQKAFCCRLMYARRASGNVFYDHYYSNELEMCFESPKSLSMNGYPWRL